MRPFLFVFLVQSALSPGTAESPVPVAEEPRHKLVFENAFVRVIDATLPAGYESLYHTHARDNVPVAVLGGRIRTDMPGQKSRETDVVAGQAWFSPGGYAHRVTNIGPETVRFIDAEILETPPSEVGAAVATLAGHVLEIENARARVYRVTLPPGASCAEHRHAKAVLRVTVPGTGLALPVPYSWHPSGRVPAAENRDAAPLQLVEIEWTGR
ncbi:MAG TPA: cupin domain-containing protein [Thermoanaerobaculia bacterium]|nr:cupin domain-containing protein [Thermoanaerobaculia bacterium]HQR67270.1 cupin domain-containing protein [Thermoanaerobaculia bacterium]